MNGPGISSFLSSPVGNGILITAGVALAVWVVAHFSAEQHTNLKRPRYRTLPLMIMVAMACSSLFLMFYALAFRATDFVTTGPAPTGADPTTGARLAPITIAAGLFGGVLFIAFTVLKYRSHVQADEKLAIDQKTAKLQTAEHFSERFAQAAEMLGSEKTATRMGGVYALAALADEWTENRQQCVDLLCGYLRTPIQWMIDARSGQAKEGGVQLPPSPATPLVMIPRPENSNAVNPRYIEGYREERREIATQYSMGSAVDEVAVRKAIASSIARGTRR